ncbi:hypothetical protein Y1Q_0008238 [Alligator mississippiensis]|uniref:Uncharacterized protein n=1 Tax=Alligator mississippiensis TaxID=8496 RepID=A0A151N1S1_ALLMI|nr:hypothetical protein Y1Q_0008238 [Alligator mississippiensis]
MEPSWLEPGSGCLLGSEQLAWCHCLRRPPGPQRGIFKGTLISLIFKGCTAWRAVSGWSGVELSLGKASGKKLQWKSLEIRNQAAQCTKVVCAKIFHCNPWHDNVCNMTEEFGSVTSRQVDGIDIWPKGESTY